MRQLFVMSIMAALSACVATPGTSQMNHDTSDKTPSTGGIKQQEEAKYAKLLFDLKKKNAQQDAKQALAKGDRHVLGYQSGRGGLKIPGINPSQNRCAVHELDGMGDTIFGENHLRYRVALRHYANQYNQVMLPYCR